LNLRLLKREPKRRSPEPGPIGRSGTRAWGGRITEDYKYDLAGRSGVAIYDKMRRSDTQVAMTLRGIKLPILQAKWTVQPSEDDPDGERIAMAVERMLFAGGVRHWRSVLRHALLCLDFGFCVDSQTEILTKDGWKPHTDLAVGELVLTFNEYTERSEWQPVQAINRFPGRHRMRRLTGCSHDSLTTASHRWLVRKHDTKKLCWTTTERLNTSDAILRGAPCDGLPVEATHSDAFVELIAWFTCEGQWTGTNKANAAIWQTNMGGRGRIESCLTTLFGPPVDNLHQVRSEHRPAWGKKHHRNGSYRYFLNNYVADMLAKICSKDDRRVELSFVHTLTIDQLRLFIDIAVMADGYKRGNNAAAFYQSVPGRVDAIEMAGILLGYACPRNTTGQGLVGVLLTERTETYPITSAQRSGGRATAEWVVHDGTVWCPTVANGTWYARRNGQAYFTGNSVLEEVWELRDRPEQMKDTGAPERMYWLASLEPRLPQTIDKWIGLDEPPYALKAIQQILPGGKNPPPIPAENAVVFTNEREGDNLEGKSLLRSAYKSWYYVEMLEKIDAIGLERAAVGLPHFHYDTLDGLDVNDAIRRAEDIMAHLNASESSYVITLPGMNFELCSGTYNNDAIRNTIQAHKRDISVNALMQFMELGANNSAGSRATAKEQKGPFDLSLLAVADEIAETLSEETIKDIVVYNWGERPGYPKLIASGILDTDMRILATIVRDLVQVGALTADETMEDWLRDTLSLPALEREAPRANRHMAQEEPKPFWREVRYEERFVAFAQIKDDLDAAKEGFQERVGSVASEVAEGLVSDAMRFIRKGDYESIAALKASGVPKLTSKIKGELKPLVAYGRQTVRDEHERARKGIPADNVIRARQSGVRGYADDLLSDDGIKSWQAVKAARRAKAIAEAIEASIIDEALRMVRAAAEATLALKTLTETAENTVKRTVLNTAGLLIAEAFGMGRGVEIKEQIDEGLVSKGIYSALLDDNVCEVCQALDGQEFAPGSAEFEKYQDGNADDCLGGSRCRCMLFLQYSDMDESEVKDWKPGDDPSVVMP
jgi:hypothetical protein